MKNIINNIKELKYEIIIFLVEMICMILELVASRIISPYFGSTNIVWTSVIGIILLSGSVGFSSIFFPWIFYSYNNKIKNK